MAKKYLYGAAVQGIQSFIFRTNVLREIVAASAEVQRICMSGSGGLFSQYEEAGGQSVIRAAGNVKYVFQSNHPIQCVLPSQSILPNFAGKNSDYV